MGSLGSMVTGYSDIVDNVITATNNAELGSNQLSLAGGGKGSEVLCALKDGSRKRIKMCNLVSSGCQIGRSSGCCTSLMARASTNNNANGGEGRLGILRGKDDTILEG